MITCRSRAIRESWWRACVRCCAASTSSLRYRRKRSRALARSVAEPGDAHQRMEKQAVRSYRFGIQSARPAAAFARPRSDERRTIRKGLGRPREAYDRSVDVHISNIRQKLAGTAGDTINIETVRSIGYRIR